MTFISPHKLPTVSQIPFVKMHGLGNDFVILKSEDLSRSLASKDIKRICDRRHGVGCDQLFILSPSEKADMEALIYNADGSEAEACGNGTRCVAALLNQEKVTIKTKVGILKAQCFPSGIVEIETPSPLFQASEIPLNDTNINPQAIDLNNGLPLGFAVNVGNPHIVFFVDSLSHFDLSLFGAKIENNPMFLQRINVEFAQIQNPQSLKVRVWERGVGITSACGSGACAVSVAAMKRNIIPGPKVKIAMDGGTLEVKWHSPGSIFQKGPTETSFKGYLFLESLK